MLRNWRPPAWFLLNFVVRNLPSRRLRSSIYRALGVSMDPSAVIMMYTEVLAQRGLAIGPRATIGQHCLLDARGGITIGADANISSYTKLLTAGHDIQSPDFRGTEGPIVIEDHAWVATGSIVLPGVTIGRGAVVGAGSVVTHDVAANAVVAGAPAKVIGERGRSLTYRLPGVARWH